MKTSTFLLCTALLAMGCSGTSRGATADHEGHAYRHHVTGIFGGSVKSDSKTAATYGFEYMYQVHPKLALGLFYEWSSGDYEAEGGGVPFAISLTENVELLLAAGVERELFEHDEFLLRAGANYTVHLDRFTLAPAAWVDFVHGKQILFVGVMAGIGF